MQRGKVIFVRSNLMDEDVRVIKEMRALRKEGYATALICWDRKYKGNKSMPLEDSEEIRLKLKAPWGIKILPFLLIWWCFVFIRLLTTRWDTVHAINSDCIIPSLTASKLKRKSVIYEILDVYEDEMVLPRAVRAICIKVDKLFMRLADVIVVADEAQIEGVGGIPNSKIVPIYDSPPNDYGEKSTSYQRNEVFTLFYAGVLYRTKRLNLDKVLEAIKDMEGVKLIIAGYGDAFNDMREITEKLGLGDKVVLAGRQPYEILPKFIAASDVCLLPAYNNEITQDIVPIKMYEYMAMEKPVIATSLPGVMKEFGEDNGVVYVDKPEDVVAKAMELIQNGRIEELGTKARRFVERYSWDNTTDEFEKILEGSRKPKMESMIT